MSLPALFTVPQSPEEWRAWSFSHASNHYDWIAAAQLKQQNPIVLATNHATAAGNNVLTFASTTSLQINGTIYQMYIIDQTTPEAIPTGTTIKGSNPTQIEMSNNAASPGVGSGDSIGFTLTQPLDLQQFQLDPMDPNNVGLWLYNHQFMHNQMNQVLGTSGFDFLDLDWSDPDQLQEWLRLNGAEHQRISAALGVG